MPEISPRLLSAWRIRILSICPLDSELTIRALHTNFRKGACGQTRHMLFRQSNGLSLGRDNGEIATVVAADLPLLVMG